MASSDMLPLRFPFASFRSRPPTKRKEMRPVRQPVSRQPPLTRAPFSLLVTLRFAPARPRAALDSSLALFLAPQQAPVCPRPNQKLARFHKDREEGGKEAENHDTRAETRAPLPIRQTLRKQPQQQFENTGSPSTLPNQLREAKVMEISILSEISMGILIF